MTKHKRHLLHLLAAAARSKPVLNSSTCASHNIRRDYADGCAILAVRELEQACAARRCSKELSGAQSTQASCRYFSTPCSCVQHVACTSWLVLMCKFHRSHQLISTAAGLCILSQHVCSPCHQCAHCSSKLAATYLHRAAVVAHQAARAPPSFLPCITQCLQ